MKSLRESAREFNHAWADLLRVLAEILNEAAARFDGRAFADETREIRDEMESYRHSRGRDQEV